MAIDIAAGTDVGGARRRARAVRLSTKDRIAVAVMVGVPTLVVGALIWFPTVASIILSFTNWDGIGGVGTAHWVGTQNYREIATIYPPFWPAVERRDRLPGGGTACGTFKKKLQSGAHRSFSDGLSFL